MAEKLAQPKQMPGWLNFVIGGLSGMMAICIVQPMDLIKTRMQLAGPAGKDISTLTMAKTIAAREGLVGFYTGISAALFRQATYTTGRLGCFNAVNDIYKNYWILSRGQVPVGCGYCLGGFALLGATSFALREGSITKLTEMWTLRSSYGVPNFAMKIVIGMVSGGVGAFIGTPAEVALIRMTADGRLPADKRRNYQHVIDALTRITREEGVTTLWRGTGATVTRAMVVNGAQLGTYAQARQALLPSIGEGIFLHFCASMIAGFVTSFASLPVDIVKTRVQNAEKGASQLGVLLSVIKNEGVFALWRGFLPTYAKIGPHTVLTFIFLEQLNALYYKMSKNFN